MYFKKVYFQNNVAIFSGPLENLPGGSVDAASLGGLTNVLKVFLDPSAAVVIVFADPEPERSYEAFCAMFKQVTAAGGLMQDGEGKMLLIHRRGWWDLPKGHQEKGESVEECAVREVFEETGIKAEKLGKLLCVTDHCYCREGVWELKHTWWFDMFCGAGVCAVPQTEEDITEAVWKDVSEIPACLAGSYPAIKDVMAVKQILPLTV